VNVKRIAKYDEFSLMREPNECVEMRDRKKKLLLSRARTHTFLLLSLSRRDPETVHWTVRGTQAPESYWTQMCLGVRCNSFAACVKRARGNFSASTNGSLPHSDL
jgi:hypothetical protein